jgi:hypothetical protein
MSFCSPLKAKKVEEEKELPLFKPEKPILTRSEARKILLYSGEVSRPQILWTQNWLSLRIRERSLPPQLAGADAFGQILRFLAPHDASALLAEIRADFLKTVPLEPKDDSFLAVLANEAYHECQDPPHSSSRNSQKSDDDQSLT